MSEVPQSEVAQLDARIHFCDDHGLEHDAVVTAVKSDAVSNVIDLRYTIGRTCGWSIPYSRTPQPFSWHWPEAA